MQAAIALLKAALALLIAVQANPQLPASFQTSAVSLANTAIATAEQTLEAPPTQAVPAYGETAGAAVAPQVAQSAPAIVPSSGSAQDCTPTLASYVTQSGDAEEGVTFTFNASSTFPTGCSGQGDAYTLQTPTTQYTGNLNDSNMTAPGVYPYSQGWGYGGYGPASGSFTWTVDGTSTTASFVQQ